MAQDRWTVVLVPDDDSGVRQYRLSRSLIRWSATGALLLFTVLSTLAAGFFVQESQRIEAERLSRANALLEEEIAGIHSQIAAVDASLDQLAQKDERFRLLAGLDPFDEEVQQVGIGGPGTSTTPRANALWALDRNASELAFNTSQDLNTLLRRARFLETSWDEATRAIEAENERFRATPSILPTGGFISSGFSKSRFHPILHVARPHQGIDVSAPHGTRVTAAADGKVSFVGYRGDYGLTVEIDHGYDYVTRYAHLSKTSVKRAETVNRGLKIGEVGATGLVTTASLHYEVRVDGRAQDPRDYILGDVLPF